MKLITGTAAACTALALASPAVADDDRRALADTGTLFSMTIPDGPDAGFSPEIGQVVVSIPATDPDMLEVRIETNATVPDGYTNYGQAGVFFDTDGDGADNFGTTTPGGQSMVKDWLYLNPLYRNPGNDDYAATSASVGWVHEATAFTAIVPWRLLGNQFRLVTWIAAGDNTSDLAPNSWSGLIKPKTHMIPKAITKVKVKKRRGKAIITWKAQPVAKRYLLTARIKKKTVKAKVKKSRAVLVATPKSKVTVKIRGKGEGGLGPVKRIKFRMK